MAFALPVCPNRGGGPRAEKVRNGDNLCTYGQVLAGAGGGNHVVYSLYEITDLHTGALYLA